MKRIAALALLVLALVPAAVAREPDEGGTPYPTLIAQHGPAVVRLKFVISFEVGGQENRQEGEASAVVVSPDGLVLVADGLLNPKPSFSGAVPAGMVLPEPTVDELRIRLADSEQELRAVQVTRDSDLGLAWLRIVSPPSGLAWVDLSKFVEPRTGQAYYGIARVSEDYGLATVAAHGYVLGETDTPTQGFLVSGPLDLAFDHEGRPMGFVTRFRTRDVRYYAQFGGLLPQQMIAAKRVARATVRAREVVTAPPK